MQSWRRKRNRINKKKHRKINDEKKNGDINSKRGKWKGINETIGKKYDRRRAKPYNIHNILKDIDIQIYGKMNS